MKAMPPCVFGQKVSDQHNASIAQTFIISVLNVVEDNDQDGIEDHYDKDMTTMALPMLRN